MISFLISVSLFTSLSLCPTLWNLCCEMPECISDLCVSQSCELQVSFRAQCTRRSCAHLSVFQQVKVVCEGACRAVLCWPGHGVDVIFVESKCLKSMVFPNQKCSNTEAKMEPHPPSHQSRRSPLPQVWTVTLWGIASYFNPFNARCPILDGYLDILLNHIIWNISSKLISGDLYCMVVFNVLSSHDILHHLSRMVCKRAQNIFQHKLCTQTNSR